MKVAIIDFSLKRNLSEKIKNSLDDLNVNYDSYYMESSEDLNKISSGGYSHVVVRAPCDINERKQLANEVIYLLENYTNIKVLPTLKELLPYENKRYLSLCLEMNNIPHPKTNVFFTKESATNFIKSAQYPVIYKSNIGAASSGVRIIENEKEAKSVIKKAFGLHPYMARGNAPTRKKCGITLPEVGRSEKHFVLFQKMVKFKWEWRLIKVNDYVIAYKKLQDENGFSSGSGKFGYGLPPEELLKLNEENSRKLGINVAAFDYFETEDGQFLVNEIQCLFGAKPDYKDYDSKMFDENMNPIYIQVDNGNFNVMQGDICKHEVWDLRMKEFLNI